MSNRLQRAFLTATAVTVVMAASQVAQAGGTVKPSRTELTEISGGWKVFLDIKVARKPPTAHQPFRFIFKRVVLFETFLDDAHGDVEQTRNIPTPDQADMIESMDVGFGDAKGNIWETTKLDFTIRRDRGFESGEYKVEVRDADNQKVGTPFTLKLQGKNTVIDRRAMVMAGNTKKKPPEPKPEDKPKDDAKADAPKTDEPKTDEPDAKKAPAPPPAVPPKKSGCGCEVPGSENTSSGLLVALSICALGAARVARTRRRSSVAN